MPPASAFLVSAQLFLRHAGGIASMAALTCATALGAAEPLFGPPAHTALMEAPTRQETSGLAASRRSADVLWLHDDSKGRPALFAVTTAGKFVGTLVVDGVKNDDWEDLATFTRDGKHWLLIADTGDNDAKRGSVRLHVIEEPARDRLSATDELTVKPAWTVRVRYEDGPRDCEAVAVDDGGRTIYLLSKRDTPPRLYRIDLEAKPTDGTTVIARHVGDVPNLPQPSLAEQFVRGHTGKRRSEVTAVDFAPDGSAAVVLTYGAAALFRREGKEPWAQALAREPSELLQHSLLQAEAAAFSADGKTIFVASEGLPLVVRFDRK
jgi:hypothetical protein